MSAEGIRKRGRGGHALFAEEGREGDKRAIPSERGKSMRRKGELSREGVAILSGKRLEFDMSLVRGEIGTAGYGLSVRGRGSVRCGKERNVRL